MSYLAIKFLHVIGAVVVLGTGVGIAFSMLMVHLSRVSASYVAILAYEHT